MRASSVARLISARVMSSSRLSRCFLAASFPLAPAIGPPGRFPDPGDKALQIVIELARHDVAHPQCLQVRHQLLIEKAAVRPHDDGHVLPIVPANLLDQMTERLRRRIGMVRVLLSSPEDRVDHVPVPSHLKRLKAFYPLVGGRRAVALLGLIVVHHHGIQAQEDQRRRLQPQAPQKQLLQQAAKQPDAIHVKDPEKALDRMRG